MSDKCNFTDGGLRNILGVPGRERENSLPTGLRLAAVRLSSHRHTPLAPGLRHSHGGALGSLALLVAGKNERIHREGDSGDAGHDQYEQGDGVPAGRGAPASEATTQVQRGRRRLCSGLNPWNCFPDFFVFLFYITRQQL